MNQSKRNALMKVSGAALAAAAAGVFMTANIGTAVAAGEKDAVHCAGVNSCKGTSECKTAHNGCKGQNSCKGKGWVSAANEKECKDKGGKVAK